MKMLSHLLASFLILLAFAGAVSAEEDEVEISDAQLDSLLAPIALYPDTVLSHILIASTYPLEVVEAQRWAEKQEGLDNQEVLLAAELKDWDPSVQALTPFPQILQRMSEDLQWMQQLGDAFLQSEARVLSSIQKLRQRAYEEGNLESNEYQTVDRRGSDIIIEPLEREVVYVPYYDTRVVYGGWWWPAYPPCHWAWHYPVHYRHPYHRLGLFVWTPGFYLGYGVYFGGFHWSHRQVVVTHHHRPHHYTPHHHVAHHSNSRRWQHNPHHRRGVNYRTPSVSRRYAGNGSVPSHRLAVYQRNNQQQRYNSENRSETGKQRHQQLVEQMREPKRYNSQSDSRQQNHANGRSQQASPRNQSQRAGNSRTEQVNERSPRQQAETTRHQQLTEQMRSQRNQAPARNTHTGGSRSERTSAGVSAHSRADNSEAYRSSQNLNRQQTHSTSQQQSRYSGESQSERHYSSGRTYSSSGTANTHSSSQRSRSQYTGGRQQASGGQTTRGNARDQERRR